MKIILDPTSESSTDLFFDQKVFEFPHSRRDCGATLIRKLAKLKVGENDELAVVVGPGNFTAVRTACLVGNSVRLATNCQLFSRKKDESRFKKVRKLIPFYSSAPAITIPKK